MPPAKKSAKTTRAAPTTRVSAVRHRDRRANIPTETLRDFVADEDKAPKTILLPHDSRDPQLISKGNDLNCRDTIANRRRRINKAFHRQR